MSLKTNSPHQSTYLKHILISQALGLPLAYLLTGYFSNLYKGTFQFIVFGLFFQISCGLIISLFSIGETGKNRSYLSKNWTAFITLIVVFTFTVSTIALSLQFPGLFDSKSFFMRSTSLPLFSGLIIVSTVLTISLARLLSNKGIMGALKESRFFIFIQKNRTGIFLSTLFFLAYFILAQSLDFPGHRTLDQYFDTDISDWITRLTVSPSAVMPTIRAVHPAVMIFLRPLVWIISIALNGNELQAVYFLIALSGTSCVFLVWLLVESSTENTTYASIIASLLGIGTSHLLLSSMLETYIFSAFALILFCFLLQSNRTSLKFTVPVGVLIFGITVTNLVQAGILYFFKLPSIKLIFKFVLAVITIVLLLNIIQVNIFPDAQPIYKSNNLKAEQKYEFYLFETSWRFSGRVNLISRAILLYGIVAPDPYILMDELGSNVPNFRTFQITIGEFHVAGYKGLADITVKFWIFILGVSFILFVFGFIKSPRRMSFPMSLILCMGFNFALHILYGDDPMLYSPNWTYAVILFVSSSFERWADNKWLQVGLIIFLGMIIYTNLGLIHQIMEVSLPFYGK